jgi:hypothetical protein
MMAAIVVPAGARSIAMMRACLVSVRTDADRVRDLPLLIFRAAERVATLVFDLALVMGSSEVRATPSAAPPQPRPGKLAGRARSRSRLSRPRSRHSNAPIKRGSQSILSKIVAQISQNSMIAGALYPIPHLAVRILPSQPASPVP